MPDYREPLLHTRRVAWQARKKKLPPTEKEVILSEAEKHTAPPPDQEKDIEFARSNNSMAFGLAEAISIIQKMDSADAIDEFTSEDDRKGVLSVADKRKATLEKSKTVEG